MYYGCYGVKCGRNDIYRLHKSIKTLSSQRQSGAATSRHQVVQGVERIAEIQGREGGALQQYIGVQ
ncbi:hypothetical protein AG1IA_09577 [Rhizoctonia solani AG-1 IA]|uniref:Uncharacterized protein n=1 Tax=Thanatephorus cucumeris (strain AG1-IA) TaxID=983506 RepID=L8WJ60_THACA|nr:hypothetical protein AG1IA_09577 [Rhizoctonia solani AG-1 IA]